MSLSREKFEELGGAFTQEDYRSPVDADQPVFAADVTLDGHTEHLQGKSEEDVLAQAENLLHSRGKL